MSAPQPLADIQFIRDFAAFCRSRGDEGYSPADPFACAVAQFGCHGITGYEDECSAVGVPYEAFHTAVLSDEPKIFSALATRLEALIADSPLVERAS